MPWHAMCDVADSVENTVDKSNALTDANVAPRHHSQTVWRQVFGPGGITPRLLPMRKERQFELLVDAQHGALISRADTHVLNGAEWTSALITPDIRCIRDHGVERPLAEQAFNRRIQCFSLRRTPEAHGYAL